jgi:hypothetical protein
MEPGDLPFPASGIVPSTSTDFPSNEVVNGVAEGSGMSSNISLEPDTCRTVLPFVTSTFPAIIAVDCFIVNPFLPMASRNWFSVAMFPGFIFTDASPFARLTSTESTPGTDFNDTRTACAQTSQSMPKIVMSMDLISPDADATNSNKIENNAIVFFISSPSVSVETTDS